MKRIKLRTTVAGLISFGISLFGFLPIPEMGEMGIGTVAAQLRPEFQAPKDEESWDVIYINNQRIGHSRSTTREITQNGRKIIHSTNDTSLTIKRFGQTLKMKTSLQIDETRNGDMLSYRFEMKNPPATMTSTRGTIRGKELEIETNVANRKQTKTIAWDPEVKSPAYQDQMLSNPPIKPGETRSFKTFMPEYNKVTTIKISADEMRSVKMHDGTEKKLLKVRITHSILPTVTTRAYLDKEGKAVKTEQDMLGMSMVTYTVPKEVALKEIAGEELDIAVNTLVKVDRIRDAHRKRRAVYRITLEGDDPSKYIVSGSTQQLKKVKEDVVDITVTSLAIPRNARILRPDEEFLKATQFLQCKDRQVVEHAQRAAAGEIDISRIVTKMEKYVHDKLTKKNFSTALASAAEVAKNLEGDCTEHAVLLAAMLRAKKIPSRIAVGMVYIDRISSFGGHMWTEAFLDGKWIPLDATLGQGGIGAGHIKLADSSFSDDAPAPVTSFMPLINLLGKIEIEVLRTE